MSDAALRAWAHETAQTLTAHLTARTDTEYLFLEILREELEIELTKVAREQEERILHGDPAVQHPRGLIQWLKEEGIQGASYVEKNR